MPHFDTYWLIHDTSHFTGIFHFEITFRINHWSENANCSCKWL